MSDLDVPGVTRIPPLEHRIRNSQQGSRKQGEKSRFEQETGGGKDDPEAQAEENAPHEETGKGDTGDGTGLRVNVTA